MFTTEKIVIYVITGITLLLLIAINMKLSDIRNILKEQKEQKQFYKAQREIREIGIDIEKHANL